MKPPRLYQTALTALLIATFCGLAPGQAPTDGAIPTSPTLVGPGEIGGIALDALDPATVALMSPYQRRELFREANALYYSQDYAEAARLYTLLLEAGVEQAPLYYNAGNAWYKAGQTGLAVWHYEKARRLAPRDERLLANLRAIAPPENHFQPFILLRPFVAVAQSLSLNESLLLAGVAWWVGLALMALAALAFSEGRWRRRTRALGWTVLMVFTALILLAGAQYWNQVQRPGAIIVADDVTGYTAPRDNAAPQFQDTFPPGWRVLILQNLAQDWSEIRLPDGARTYVRSHQIRRL